MLRTLDLRNLVQFRYWGLSFANSARSHLACGRRWCGGTGNDWRAPRRASSSVPGSGPVFKPADTVEFDGAKGSRPPVLSLRRLVTVLQAATGPVAKRA